jgi:enoyl-CoA hydratase/carnithine racemase
MSTNTIPNDDRIIIRDKTSPPHRSITLNRPNKRNALDLQTLAALTASIASAGDQPILISATPPAFCAGLDLKELANATSPNTHLQELVKLLVVLANHPSTTIAYVQGPARAGGVALACCADRVIAHPSATFMIPGDEFYKPMASILPPILAARRNLPSEKADALRGCLLNAPAAKSMGIIDDVIENQEGVAIALNRATQESQLADAQPPAARSRSITPAILQEVNARIDSAVNPEAVANLIKHLRDRFGRPS